MQIQDLYGKPTAKKITSDIEVRNWDPTDPDKENPWNEYLKGEKNNKPENENKNDNTNTSNTNKTNTSNNKNTNNTNKAT